MSPTQAVLLIAAGFGAGAVNAVAGGGSLISFPALLGVGLGSVPANVTNTVALWPGYLGGAFGYRRELVAMRDRLPVFLAISVIGGTAGAVLLLSTPGSIFTSLVPWLVLGGTVLFASQPLVAQHVLASRVPGNKLPADNDAGRLQVATRQVSTPVRAGVLLTSVYGAYFGAGLGVMLLAVLGILRGGQLQEFHALKNSLSLSINTVALIAFALFGPVHWFAVLLMAVASLTGGYGGSLVARRLPPAVMRTFVIVFGLLVSAKLFLG